MIVCENLSKLFDANSGIKDVNLQFECGVIYGIIGYNGSGKTTLLNCIEGLYIPTSGSVYHNKIKTTDEDDFLNKRFNQCSMGMKKKVQIIASLVGEIDAIIWDEPNDGLDILSNIKIKEILKFYKSQNVTILFSCHVIEFLADFIDHCIIINKGQITANTEMKNIESLEKLYIGNTPNISLNTSVMNTEQRP